MMSTAATRLATVTLSIQVLRWQGVVNQGHPQGVRHDRGVGREREEDDPGPPSLVAPENAGIPLHPKSVDSILPELRHPIGHRLADNRA